MRRLAVLLILLAGLFGPAGAPVAQTSEPPRDKVSGAVLSKADFVTQIRKRLVAIQKVYRKGQKDRAYGALAVLNAEVDAQADFLDGHVSLWWPDLVLGRLKLRDRDWAGAEAAVTPIAPALDTDRYRQGPTRMEAMLILARALTHQKKYEAAEAIARALLREAPPDLKPKWRLLADSYLALAATWAGAADAPDLRRSLLDGYLDRDGATMKDYLRFWRMDLDRRRQADRHAADLVRDARWLDTFIRTNEEAAAQDLTAVKAGLGRIFAENRDYKRAEPIFREQLAVLEPGTVKYYWAWQNLIATHARQKRYALALQEAAPLVEELEARDETYAKVTATILRDVGETAKKAGDDALYNDAIQRAYVAIRRVRSANHKDALRIRRALDLARIDPDTFPFAEELGLRSRMGDLQLSVDGANVLEAFFAGSYAPLGRRLRILARKPGDEALAQLNLGLYHALLGEIGPAETAIAKARSAARSAAGSAVPANSPLFDLYLAMTQFWGREWAPHEADSPIARLLARTDLTADQARTLDVMRVALAQAEDDFATGRRIYAERLADFDPGEDTSPWGILRALTMIGPVHEFAPRDAAAFDDKVSRMLDAAGNPRLARTILVVALSNASEASLANEQTFQTLAFHLQAMSRLLPPEHDWQAVARVNFAFGLWDRGRFEDAQKLFVQTARQYRASPWHRADVLAYLEMQQAVLNNSMGNFDLAFSILSQIWEVTDPDTFKPTYWREILSNYAFGLIGAGRPEDALALTRAAVDDPARLARMSPADRAMLMLVHSQILRQNGHLDDALTWVERARAVVPSRDYRQGFAMESVLSELAGLNYERNDHAGAYAAMRQANDIHFSRIEQARGENGAEVARNRERDKSLIVSEVVYGWLLAEDLTRARNAAP